ncbi:hypothetical protein A4X13_0g3146 [Tilletia indica]|uniref:F-box domain-containing protein n=1 Tax=Tilletia indica TaxID=43049 RepID=A0A177TQN7_9BASI|nr:hypothetical protein A4X13_0g3146 [Tilletia indica]
MEAAVDVDKASPPTARATRSAASRVLDVPALLRLILAHTTRDKIDLLSASCVSKHFRSVAMPLLWCQVDVPLSKIGNLIAVLSPQVDNFLASRRDRFLRPIHYIQVMRIYDDEGYRRFRYEPHSKPVHFPTTWCAKERALSRPPGPEVYDPRWEFEVSKLFDILETMRKIPLVELSFGVLSSFAVDRVLSTHSRIADRVASVRVLSDALQEVDGPVDLTEMEMP